MKFSVSRNKSTKKCILPKNRFFLYNATHLYNATQIIFCNMTESQMGSVTMFVAIKKTICLAMIFLFFENYALFGQLGQDHQEVHDADRRSSDGFQQQGIVPVSPETAQIFGLPTQTQTPNTTPLPPLPPPREPDPTLGMRVAESVPFSLGANLPSNNGQIGRAYEISPYTHRPTQSQSPQNTITNWILRRTGQEFWHGEPFGFMSATRQQLIVYHTPEMQNFIADTVDRFVSSKNAQKTFSLRIFSLNSPDWRSRNFTNLIPIRINTPGVQGWLISTTHVGLLLDNIARRNDVREHVSSNSVLLNAQTTTVPYQVTRNYVRDVQARPSAPGGYITDPTSLTEGFQFEITPLLSLDGKTLEARVKCDLVQVDKMHPLTFNTPSSASPSAKVTVEVPQVANFSVDELISWPADTVLLLDLGIVPLLIPTPQQTRDKNLLEQVIAPLTDSAPPKRSNVLIMIRLQTDAGTTNDFDHSDATVTYNPEPPPSAPETPPQSPITEGTPLDHQLPPANPQ